MTIGRNQSDEQGSRKSRKTSNVFSILPSDIIHQIFLKLTASALLRVKSVCKSWYALLNDPIFIRLHLDQSIEKNVFSYIFHTVDKLVLLDGFTPESKLREIDYKSYDYDINILGYCNGIFLIGLYRESTPWDPPYQDDDCVLLFNRLSLWNPTTNEFVEIPDMLSKLPKYRTQCRRIVYGLGHDSSTDDYKVIRMIYSYKETKILRYIYDDYESEVHVYSLRTNSCKRIQDVPYVMFNNTYNEEHINFGQNPHIVFGEFLNGAVHWLGFTGENKTRICAGIVSFNIAKEEFNMFTLPVRRPTTLRCKLGTLNGRLCIYRYRTSFTLDVFMMMEYGVNESWTTIFSTEPPQVPPIYFVFNPLSISSDSKLMAQWEYEHLVVHDIKHGSRKQQKHDSTKYSDHRIADAFEDLFYVKSYIDSLVSLRQLQVRKSI